MTAQMRFDVGANVEVSITAIDCKAVTHAVAAHLKAGRGFTLATLNLDHLVKLRHDAAFREAYAATTLVTADGNPIVWLSRLARRPVRLTPGSDLIAPLCATAVEAGAPVALFGSTDQTLAAAEAALCAAHPGLDVALRIAPPYGFDPTGREAEGYARRIAESDARLCLVALGAPKQEIFAVFAQRHAPSCGFASIGAGLDFLAGAQTRAPILVRRMAMEWLWRALSDPRRLAGRYIACATALPRMTVRSLRLRFCDLDN